MKRLILLVLFSGVVTGNLNAQITITVQDFQGVYAPGGALILNQADTIKTVHVGVSSSLAQTFDFTSLHFAPIDSLAMVSPQSTPYVDSFPNSNYAEAQIRTGDTHVLYYVYYELTDSWLSTDGYVLVGNGIKRYAPPEPEVKLPLTLGVQWEYIPPLSVVNNFTFYDTIYNLCDAYGTVKIPGASFDCIRVKQINAQEEDSNGVLRSYGRSYAYYYYTKEGFVIRAYPFGEDTALATISRGQFQILQPVIAPASIHGIKSSAPNDITLQLYPSPLTASNNLFTISYNLPHAAVTDLTLVNILGQTIEHIDESVQTAGSHTLTVKTPDVSAGAYFCTVRAGARSVTQPVLIER